MERKNTFYFGKTGQSRINVQNAAFAYTVILFIIRRNDDDLIYTSTGLQLENTAFSKGSQRWSNQYCHFLLIRETQTDNFKEIKKKKKRMKTTRGWKESSFLEHKLKHPELSKGFSDNQQL